MYKKYNSGKLILILGSIALLSACPRPGSANNPPTITIGGGAFSVPDRILNGPVPGCVDAVELVSQTAVLPLMPVTLDAQNIFDRIDTSVTGATYTYSIRPVNAFDCTSTRLPASPPVTISFGFNYSGDFSRVDPLCMNASTIALTSFSITGTPIDLLIEPFFHGIVWVEVDDRVADSMHTLINGGVRPVNANPRCSNWVDQTTL